MTDDDIKDLKKDLLQLFMKYNVSIGFTCADCSDTYGLYDDHIVIQDNNSRENVLETDGWWLNISSFAIISNNKKGVIIWQLIQKGYFF